MYLCFHWISCSSSLANAALKEHTSIVLAILQEPAGSDVFLTRSDKSSIVVKSLWLRIKVERLGNLEDRRNLVRELLKRLIC